MYEQRGDYQRALEHHRRALAILEPVLGPGHYDIAGVLTNIAVCEQNLGNRDAAEKIDRRVLAIMEAQRGPDHVEVGRILVNIGVIQLTEGRYLEAEATLARSAKIPRLFSRLRSKTTARPPGGRGNRISLIQVAGDPALATHVKQFVGLSRRGPGHPRWRIGSCDCPAPGGTSGPRPGAMGRSSRFRTTPPLPR